MVAVRVPYRAGPGCLHTRRCLLLRTPEALWTADVRALESPLDSGADGPRFPPVSKQNHLSKPEVVDAVFPHHTCVLIGDGNTSHLNFGQKASRLM